MFVQLTREFLGRQPGERIDLAEADAKTLVAAGTAVPVADDPVGPLVQQALARAADGLAGQVQSAVDAALKQFASAQALSRKHNVPAIFGPGGQG
ncbi:MAG: hypothetical protein K2W96_22855, partial [Gemmataceae bacterium]|nr:hypothetical protein [Gemmataceae bacterium]